MFTISVFVGECNCYFCALVLIAIVMCFCICTHCVRCAADAIFLLTVRVLAPHPLCNVCRPVSLFDSLLIWLHLPAGISGGSAAYIHTHKSPESVLWRH